MKIIFFCFFSVIKLFGADFITFQEYAKMLYENPRGISCKKCHGNDGSEQILGYYEKKGVKIPFIVPNIQNLDYESFKISLEKDRESKSIMPTYSLTENEILTLYKYIRQLSKEKK